jgi:hypothetical protein
MAIGEAVIMLGMVIFGLAVISVARRARAITA